MKLRSANQELSYKGGRWVREFSDRWAWGMVGKAEAFFWGSGA